MFCKQTHPHLAQYQSAWVVLWPLKQKIICRIVVLHSSRSLKGVAVCWGTPYFTGHRVQRVYRHWLAMYPVNCPRLRFFSFYISPWHRFHGVIYRNKLFESSFELLLVAWNCWTCPLCACMRAWVWEGERSIFSILLFSVTRCIKSVFLIFFPLVSESGWGRVGGWVFVITARHALTQAVFFIWFQ